MIGQLPQQRFEGLLRGARRPALVAQPEAAVAVLILVLSGQPFFDLLYDDEAGGTIIQGIWSGVYLLTAVLLFRTYGERWIFWCWRHLPLLMAVGALIVLSSVWSIAPELTLRRSLSFAGTTMIGIYVASASARSAPSACS